MAAVNSYRDLVAWQKGMEIARKVYGCTNGFPADERYGLTQQMRRAAVSVPANIAEGWGRGDRRDYCRFLRIARGSLFELQTLLMLAGDFGYAGADQSVDLDNQVNECSRVLHGLIKSLADRRNVGTKNTAG